MVGQKRRILFVDNETHHDLYKPLEHWQPLFFHPYEVCRAPYERLPGLDSFSHIILSGSLSSTLEEADWMLAEEEMIRTAVRDGKALLGNCFGHQLIARALFGRGAVQKREKVEIGWPAMEVLQDDLLLGNAGDIVHGFILHFDEVRTISAEKAKIILSSDECANLAFKLINKPVWGIQPHFEIGIVQGFAVMDVVERPGVPDKSIFLNSKPKAPRDSGLIARIMHEFQGVGLDR